MGRQLIEANGAQGLGVEVIEGVIGDETGAIRMSSQMPRYVHGKWECGGYIVVAVRIKLIQGKRCNTADRTPL